MARRPAALAAAVSAISAALAAVRRGFGGFEDIFSTVFGGGASGARSNGPVPGDDLRYDLTISFEEAAAGCEKDINLVRDEECPTCHGSGATPGSKVDTCPNCNGTVRSAWYPTRRSAAFRIFEPARGATARQDHHGTLPEVHGRGKVRVSKRRTVKVPAGIDNGQILTIRGQGGMGERGGAPGDLLIVITVRPHKLFKRRDDNLYIELPLTFTQAALGAEIDVPTLGKPVKYHFPEGTAAGQVFCISGKACRTCAVMAGRLVCHRRRRNSQEAQRQAEEPAAQFERTCNGSQYEKKKSFFDRVKDAF